LRSDVDADGLIAESSSYVGDLGGLSSFLAELGTEATFDAVEARFGRRCAGSGNLWSESDDAECA
jgi:hypothetical protein